MTARVVAAIAAAPADMSEPQVLRYALTETASYALTHRARLHQLAEVRRTSADIRSSPLTRLSEQEQRLARQLAARRGSDAAPGWPTRLLVARAVAGLRVWLEDITAGDCADPWQHLQQIFDTEPLTASATCPPALAAGKPGPRGGSAGLQGYAGQLGAISEQLVLELEIAGGRVCRGLGSPGRVACHRVRRGRPSWSVPSLVQARSIGPRRKRQPPGWPRHSNWPPSCITSASTGKTGGRWAPTAKPVSPGGWKR